MKCPNPKCSCKKFLPADANFCPECGTQLRPGKVVFISDTLQGTTNASNGTNTNSATATNRTCEISFCTAYPGTITLGNRAVLKWEGNNVKSIVIEGHEYSKSEYIYLSPTTTKEYKVDFISNSGNVCSKFVQVHVQPYLFEGKGIPSTNKGYVVVDIRQCKRTEGLGMEGKYQFLGELPVGIKGYYAVFDLDKSIQVLVEGNKVIALFVIAANYTLKLWRGEKEESYQVLDDGWFIRDWVTKYRYIPVTYWGLYQDNIAIDLRLSNVDQRNKAEAALKPIKDKCSTIYAKEFYQFFGMSFQQIYDESEHYEE